MCQLVSTIESFNFELNYAYRGSVSKYKFRIVKDP